MDFNNKKVIHQIGVPFGSYARHFRIKLAKKDVEYIVNVIKKDRLYSLIDIAFQVNEPHLAKAYAKINQIVFYDKFYNSSDCPKGVKQILFVHLGVCRDYLDRYFPNLLNQRYFTVECWFETIKSKSK